MRVSGECDFQLVPLERLLLEPCLTNWSSPVHVNTFAFCNLWHYNRGDQSLHAAGRLFQPPSHLFPFSLSFPSTSLPGLPLSLPPPVFPSVALLSPPPPRLFPPPAKSSTPRLLECWLCAVMMLGRLVEGAI